MPWTTADLNAMLDSRVVDTAKLHTGDPGAAGTANEVVGGSYASKAVSFGAAANGVRTQSGSAVFDIPAGVTITHVSFWNGTTFRCSDPVTNESFTGAGTYTLSGSTLTLSNV